MTTKKAAAPRAKAAPKDEVEIELTTAEEVEQPKADKVTFVAAHHATVTTPSGAVFALAPMVPLKMSRTDADDLVATGYGSIQGG